MQAHHLIPGELETDPLVERAINAGWDIDAEPNGILLPDNMELSLEKDLPIHNTNHPAYTRMVKEDLNAIRDAAEGMTDAELMSELNQIAAEWKEYLINLGGGVPVPK
jgi:hypothetical protein